ncbi:MAG TPA: hypothetical protein VF521_16255, partial [Pyrinomonadaceae bacterium]
MKRLGAFALLVCVLCPAAFAQKLQYPASKRVEQFDTYFGMGVADPYRWLEDDASKPEVARWVEEQNRLTFSYLGRIPYRAQVKERLTKIYNYARYTAPYRRGEYYFFEKNDGLQNQSVVYVQKGIDGAPEVLLDPNKFSAEGTTQLQGLSISRDAKYAAYCKASGGSDWRDCYVMEVATRRQLADELKWVKISGIAWAGDGFYYSRYDAPEQGKELTSKNENHKVYFHKVGTPQSEDELVYQDPAHPQRFNNVGTTDDERFALLVVSDRGTGKKGNALFYRDLKSADKNWKPVVAEVGDDDFDVVDNVGDKLLVETNHNAPNGRVFLFDPKSPSEKEWKDVLPERPEPLQSANTGGGKLFATYLKDVTTRAYVYSLDGKLENEVQLPALGIAGGLGGNKDDRFVFYSFSSFTFAPSVYRYDIATRKSTLFRSPEIPGFRSSDYEVRQVFFNSKDGTRVPMFVIHKKGLKLDGRNPTLLYGYGGFNASTTPDFKPGRLLLLEQ